MGEQAAIMIAGLFPILQVKGTVVPVQQCDQRRPGLLCQWQGWLAVVTDFRGVDPDQAQAPSVGQFDGVTIIYMYDPHPFAGTLGRTVSGEDAARGSETQQRDKQQLACKNKRGAR
jgi:hypothetical protein